MNETGLAIEKANASIPRRFRFLGHISHNLDKFELQSNSAKERIKSQS